MTNRKNIFGHLDPTVGKELQEVVDYQILNSVQQDLYGGQSIFIESFQHEIANICGFESALFMPTGTMAQQVAIKIYSDRTNISKIAFHKTCHLELHEYQAYKHLHNIDAVVLGDYLTFLTKGDLINLQDVSSLIVELPQREIGGDLPSWTDLQDLKKFVKREKKAHLHLDGARLWECSPYYKKTYAEICEGFDSAYVSFYKGIGALSGCMLLGNIDFIDCAKIWMKRHGGSIFRMYPYAISSKVNFDKRIQRFSTYHSKALSLYNELKRSEINSQIAILPSPPKTNFFHIHTLLSCELASKLLVDIANQCNWNLFPRFLPSYLKGYDSFTEFYVGDNSLEFSDHEIVDYMNMFFKHAENLKNN